MRWLALVLVSLIGVTGSGQTAPATTQRIRELEEQVAKLR